ncbi:hypothetical protein [uncultured Algoriphagus sp.]|uniref:Nmad2 family putative nucleotide modification protein n=1 Tax=uncultured Algoriphagus sp. TaxID=417365 RepID=UPI0030EBAEA0|tara:strand:- start:4577 stop:5257 length:681 start_codon:yes stop_codon:yes gene_type:complete
MRLFSYCIPIDDGAAPNPYFEICTLAICKPVIRRVANVGDWVVGVGSKNVQGIDYSGKLVYAMKVTDKMTIKEYDEFCRKELVGKIPNVYSSNYVEKVGDCIYDYGSNNDGKLRPSVHNLGNRETDLGGINVLLSTHFYYFGNNAIAIPAHLTEIIKQGQGHKSDSNDYLRLSFLEWIENLGLTINHLYGSPQIRVEFKQNAEDGSNTCLIRCKSDMEDEEIEANC